MKSVAFEKYLFLTLLAVLLFPVWYFPYFPTVDGPSHAANGVNLFRLLTGSCPLTARLFHINYSPLPNYLSDIAFGLFSYVISAELADKLIISLYLILFPLSLLSFIKSIRPENKFMVFPAMIFAYNLMLFYGNYNFLYGLIILFYTLPFWLKISRQLNLANWLKLLLVFNLAYFTHIFGFAVLCISIAVGIICNFASQPSKANLKANSKFAIYAFLACLPTLIFFYWYLKLPKLVIAGANPFSLKLTFALLAGDLLTFQYDIAILYIGSILVWLMLVLGLISRFEQKLKFSFFDHLLVISLLLFVLILFIPASFGGGWVIEPRLEFVEYLFIILWLASQYISKLGKKLIIAVSSFAIILSVAIKLGDIKQYSDIAIARNQAWNYIPENSVIFSVDISPDTLNYETGLKTKKIQIPFLTSFFTAEHCVAEVSNTHSSEINTFPVSYNDSTHPNLLGELHTANRVPILPPIVDFDKYEKNTGIKINYIIIFGDKEHLYNYEKADKLDQNKLYDDFMAKVKARFDVYKQSVPGHWIIFKAKP